MRVYDYSINPILLFKEMIFQEVDKNTTMPGTNHLSPISQDAKPQVQPGVHPSFYTSNLRGLES
jgi:hypothetical protein